MAYGVVLGQSSSEASNINYDNSATSDIITSDNVQGAIDQLFTSVSEGKELIASAVTDKGVQTPADATFNTIADNIKNIATGLNSNNMLVFGGSYDNKNPVSYNITQKCNTAIFMGQNCVELGTFDPNSSPHYTKLEYIGTTVEYNQVTYPQYYANVGPNSCNAFKRISSSGGSLTPFGFVFYK